MMKFFRFLFGEDGDRTAVPDLIQGSGAVSYQEGYGPDYELEQNDPEKRNIERRQHNQLLYDLTLNSQQYHTMGFPEFITSADNGGTAYAYSLAACVRYDGHSGPGVYYSLEDNNDTDPTDATKWAFFNPTPSVWRTGDVKKTDRIDLESGWVWSNGRTIGSADSGATGRANADCYDLFVMYWQTRPNSVLPIQNSDGTPGVRGASADADWNANKRMPTPDRRGRVDAGHDAMGGAPAAGRLTDGNSEGVVGNQIGAFGGAQTHSLTALQNGPHDHTIRSADRTGPGFGFLSAPVTLSPGKTGVSGEGAPHNNVQPTIICNVMVKL